MPYSVDRLKLGCERCLFNQTTKECWTAKKIKKIDEMKSMLSQSVILFCAALFRFFNMLIYEVAFVAVFWHTSAFHEGLMGK